MHIKNPGISNPRSIPGVLAWWDAMDRSSFTLGSGNIINQWNDKSGNAYHLTGISSQPTLSSTGINGRSSVVLNGTGSLRSTTVPLSQGTGSFTLFMVASSTNTDMIQSGILANANQTRNGFSIEMVDGSLRFRSHTFDRTMFLDAVTTSDPVNAPINEGGFETPVLAANSFQYTPTGSAWTFGQAAGISTSGSAFNPATPPEGVQIGLIQGAAYLSQTTPSWAAGTYTITFQASARVGGRAGIEVYVDNAKVGEFTTLTSATYTSYTTPPFSVTSGPKVITFRGINESANAVTTYASGTPFVYSTTYANGAIQSFTNSTHRASVVGVFANSTNGFAIGSRYTTGNAYNINQANVGEVIIYNRVLTDAERRAVEWYLSRKWGVNFTSAFSPLDLGPLGWYRADQGVFTNAGTTAATTTGDVIQQWNDLSGNNRHLIQATAVNRPTLNTNAINGQSAILFDGSNDFLPWTGAISPQLQRTIYVVSKGATNGVRYVFDGWSGTNRSSIGRNSDNTWIMFAGSAFTVGTDDDSWNQHTAVFNSTNSVRRVNRVQIGSTGNVGSNTLINWVVGSGSGGTVNRFQGEVAEVIIYPWIHTAEQIALVENYLNQRYNV